MTDLQLEAAALILRTMLDAGHGLEWSIRVLKDSGIKAAVAKMAAELVCPKTNH